MADGHRVDVLARRFRALDDANLTAVAFHDPQRLAEVRRDLLEEAGMTPSADEALAAAREIIDAVARLDASGAGPVGAGSGSAIAAHEVTP